jgi:hypothetical protein
MQHPEHRIEDRPRRLLPVCFGIAAAVCACANGDVGEGLPGAAEAPAPHLDGSDGGSHGGTTAGADGGSDGGSHGGSHGGSDGGSDVEDSVPDASVPSPTCELVSMLYDNVNPGWCSGPDACAEQGTTTFSLAEQSVVVEIRTYVGLNGLPGNSFGYTVDQGATTILSGDMSFMVCTEGTEWCFFGAEVGAVLEAGSYQLGVAWPRICANPGSGCGGFVQVLGCQVSALAE